MELDLICMRLEDMLILVIEEDFYIGREIVSGVDRDVCGKVDIGDYGEAGLEVWGEVGSRYVRSVGKHVKGRLTIILDDSVGWGVIIGVDNGVFRGVDGEARM